jgi:hypothetical protein
MRLAAGLIVMLAAGAGAPRAEAQSSALLELSAFGGLTEFLADDREQLVIDIDDSESDMVALDALLEDPKHLGFNLALRVGENWAIEATFAWAESKLTAVNLDDELDVDLLRYAFTGRFDADAWDRTRVFVGLGLGWETLDYALEAADAEMFFAANALGGVGVRLVDDLRLRIDARGWATRWNGGDDLDSSAEWEKDLMLSTGLSWGLPLDR